MASGTETAPVDPGEPKTGVVAVRPVPLRITLYVLILLSAVASLIGEPQLARAVVRGSLSPYWLYLPLAIFSVCLVVYAVDRLVQVHRRRYPVGKALLQVGFGVLFALMLLPSTIAQYNEAQATRPSAEVRLLRHRDPNMRVAGVRALGFMGATAERRQLLKKLAKDPSDEVRTTVTNVLARWPAPVQDPRPPASSAGSEGTMGEKSR